MISLLWIERMLQIVLFIFFPRLEENQSSSLHYDIVHETHHCGKSIHLDIELQKSKQVIEKLKTRCAQKCAEINRLNKALIRCKLSNSSLKELLNEARDRNWISDDAHSILNVNS